MDNDLYSRLVRAEDGLLSSILAGENSLASWDSEWSASVAHLTEASVSGAQGATVAIGDAVVSKVVTIVTCLLDLRKDEDLLSQLHVDYDEILSSRHALNLSSVCTFVPRSSKTDSSASKDLSIDVDMASPPFVDSAYRWLLRHLHNPYPPHDVKQSLASISGCSLNFIKSWFTTIRKRVGWTSICREHFRGCRVDAVDAAFRALVQDDPHRPVGDELTRAFIAMKVAAEELYPSTSTDSALASGSDIVPDRSRRHGDPGILRESACHKTSEGSRSSRRLHSTVESADVGRLYVDSRSPISSLMSPLTDDDSGGDEDVLPVPAAGKKRRLLSENLTGSPLGADRPTKRLRAKEHSVISPQAPLHDTPEGLKDYRHRLHDNSHRVVSMSPYCTEATRKRSLPAGDVQGLPGDIFGPNIKPRTHAISDPLPRSTSDASDIDEWFNAHFASLFEFPPPVSAELDQTLPWEVEVCLQNNNSLQMPENSSTSDVRISDTLSDFRVGGVACESGPLLVDSHLLEPHNQEDVPPLSTSPSGSHSPDSSLPTLSPIIDWAHLFSSATDVDDTPLLHPQLGDSPMVHLMSSNPFSDDGFYASTSTLLANEQLPLERTTYVLGTSKVGAIA